MRNGILHEHACMAYAKLMWRVIVRYEIMHVLMKRSMRNVKNILLYFKQSYILSLESLKARQNYTFCAIVWDEH